MKKSLWFFVTAEGCVATQQFAGLRKPQILRRAHRPGLMAWLKATAAAPAETLLADLC